MGLTIRDVAKAAGVSTATVSNVLNKRGKVGRKTKGLVLSTVKRLGYLPNIHARRLASRDTRTLGIIVSDIENPFFPEIIKSFLSRTRQLGYEAILSDTNYDPRRTQEAASRMMAHNVSGVAIMTSEISARLINELARRKIAVTFLGSGSGAGIREHAENRLCIWDRAKREIPVPRRAPENCVRGRQPNLKSNMARLEAYEKYMVALGLEPGPILHGDLRFEGGLAAGLAIAKMSPRPTAVMAVNDLTAVGVMKGLTSMGCRIPEDISVTGSTGLGWRNTASIAHDRRHPSRFARANGG